jgi:hypothetical protein
LRHGGSAGGGTDQREGEGSSGQKAVKSGTHRELLQNSKKPFAPDYGGEPLANYLTGSAQLTRVRGNIAARRDYFAPATGYPAELWRVRPQLQAACAFASFFNTKSYSTT